MPGSDWPVGVKTRKLRLAAEGFLTGLVLCGCTGPFRWFHFQWECAFYRSWREWTPPRLDPERFPRFKVGSSHGVYVQPRDMLWQVTSGSPFHDFRDDPFPRQPMGLIPEKYLELVANEASPAEWRTLAQVFLDEMPGGTHGVSGD